MSSLGAWLEAHDKLAGWAQFFGAVLALVVTYFTAFAPTWRRKRQLQSTAARLLANGFEMVESYHRTSAHFAPFSLSVRAAALSMTYVADEMSRFPVFELDDQGSKSLARRLAAMNSMLGLTRLYLEDFAAQIEGRTADNVERAELRAFLENQIHYALGIARGDDLERPTWPTEEEG